MVRAGQLALPAYAKHPLGVGVHPLAGFKHGELGYDVDVPGGRALMIGDAVANRDYAPGLMGSLMASLSGGIKGRLGVARIVRLFLVDDKVAARAALRKLAEIPRLSILIPAHGRPLREGCAEALREAAAKI